MTGEVLRVDADMHNGKRYGVLVERDLTVPTSEILFIGIEKEMRNAICDGRKRKL